MPSFRNAKDQAKHAVKQKLGIGTARHTQRHDQKIHSLGTTRNYTQALTRLSNWLKNNHRVDLKDLNQKLALQYLEERGQLVRQKTLDQDRQAIQVHLGQKLPVTKSELAEALNSRAYTQEQVAMVTQAQTAPNALATHIAYAAGLRAHELFTLRRSEERSASAHRQWLPERFMGRTGQLYTVQGKGGLIREVLIPNHLAEQLEARRLDKPRITQDREIRYSQYYDIPSGKKWSNSFSAASQRALGWSEGAHGLRHSFAQERLEELQQRGVHYEQALGMISQLLGHFRATITEVYLR